MIVAKIFVNTVSHHKYYQANSDFIYNCEVWYKKQGNSTTDSNKKAKIY